MTYRTHLLVCMLALACAAPARAVVLTPGNFVNVSGTTSALRPELAATVIEDVIRPLSIDIGAGLLFNGSVQDRVVREDVSGTLDFYYKITNNANSSGFVDYITRQNFAGWATDVDFRTDGAGAIGVNQVSRNAGGDEVLFDFFSINTVNPGDESYFFFIKTDAKFYTTGQGIAAIGGGLAGSAVAFESFQPAVPEPCTLALLAPIAIVCGWGYRRRSHRGPA